MRDEVPDFNPELCPTVHSILAGTHSLDKYLKTFEAFCLENAKIEAGVRKKEETAINEEMRKLRGETVEIW